LVLLRHAKSDWSTSLPDEQRELAPRGRREAPEAGRWLATQLTAALDLVICSTAVRTRETWSLVSAELADPPGAVRYAERVYAAAPSALLARVQALPEDAGTVALVGHNPGIEDLASTLLDQDCTFRTSTMVIITWPGPWTPRPAPATLQARWR